MPGGRKRILIYRKPVRTEDKGIILEVLTDKSGSPRKVSFTWCRSTSRAKYDQAIPFSLDDNPPLREGLLQFELERILGTNTAHLIVRASDVMTNFLISQPIT